MEQIGMTAMQSPGNERDIQGTVGRTKRLLIIALAALAMGGCRQTEYVTVERVRTDTVRQNRIERDSIYLHDSVFVNQFQRGETVFVEKEKWHTRYQDRLLLDTLYVSKVDSVPVPCPVELEVERELTWWQKTKMIMGVGFMCFLGLLCVCGLLKWRRGL